MNAVYLRLYIIGSSHPNVRLPFISIISETSWHSVEKRSHSLNVITGEN